MPLTGQDGSSGGEADSVVTTPHFSVVDNRGGEAVASTEGVSDESPIGRGTLLTPYHTDKVGEDRRGESGRMGEGGKAIRSRRFRVEVVSESSRR